MKRIAAVLFALCFLMMLAAGCVAGEGGPSPSLSGEVNPAGSYVAYSEAKNLAFDNIATALGGDPEFYNELQSALMTAANVDFSFVSVMAVDGNEETVSMLEQLGFSGIKVERQEDGYVITFKGPDDKEYTQTCMYDASLDYMQSAAADSSGKETAFFEYVKAGDGYGAQYYIGEAQYPLVNVFTGADVSAIGIGSSSGKPGTITGNAGLGPDFVKNCETYFILKGKELTVFYNGETRMIKV